MRYYIAKGPLEKLGYEWAYSYYKVYPDYRAETTRFYSDGRVANDMIQRLSTIFIKHNCKEITEEEYKSILEL